ncbi:MAG: hypothetical protein WCY12_00360 [Candidatus Omnitrophota bacterium]
MSQQGFNPKARWDRHVPEQSDSPQNQGLNEKIQVLAWFRSGKITPCEFIWNNKNYPIKQVTYSWRERIGREIISYFSVDTGTDLYQISFNNTGFSWQLDKII